MQIKIAMEYHYVHTVAKMRRADNSWLGECGTVAAHTAGGISNGTTTVESSLEVSYKVDIPLPYDLVSPRLDIYQEK